jgi:uracil-DNA glycosylase
VVEPSALAAGWSPLVEDFLSSDSGAGLQSFLASRQAAGARIYPTQVLHALELTSFASVRVVILGQDPYHGAGQAHGLAFSVPDGQRLPPSLRNIYAELAREFGAMPPSGNLEVWARQGVLLLNAVLTVEEGQPGSHAQRGWESLTSALIAALSADDRPKVFMLWGTQAQRCASLIADPPHRVLTANHPSPLSARRPPQPYIGCGHFSQANAFLTAAGRGAIDWVVAR